MDTNLLFTLLQKIHYYYPIGLPNWNDAYPGYQELRGIIEKKVNHLIKYKVIEPWNTLVQSLTAQIKHDFILDQAYQQFPNLLLSIDLSKAKTDNIEQKKTLYLCLSLLTEHFTIFIENEYKFVNFPSKTNPKRMEQTNIVYGEKYISPDEKEKFELIKDEVKKRYPDYVFVPHDFLFYRKIKGGTPHGESPENMIETYPIYSFLFGLMNPYFEKLHILE